MTGMDAASRNSSSRHRAAAALDRLTSLVRAWWSESLFPSVSEQTNVAPGGKSLFWLLLIAAPVLLLNLSYPLLEPDENRNAQIALEMYQSGDFIVPTRIGQPYLYKPPLLFWLVAASYSLLGVHEWSARLPVALAALATVGMTYWLGRRLIGERAAWVGALLLLLTGGFVLAGRFVLMDSVLTLCTTIGLLAACVGATRQTRRAGWWLAAGVACGLGILAKGPVALVIVVPPLAATAWMSPKEYSIRWRDWAILIGASLLVAGPWYVAVTLRYPEFPQKFLWTQNLQRYTTGIDHQEPFWFYLPVLLLGMLPASLLFPALALFLTSRREEMRRMRSPALGFLTLAAGWVVVFFSLSSSKLPTYILPAIPPLCLLLGRLCDGVLLAGTSGFSAGRAAFLNWMSARFPRWAALAAGAAVLAAMLFDVLLGHDGWLGQAIGIMAACLAVGLVAAAVRGRILAGIRGWALVGTAALAAMTLGFNDVYPEIAADRSRIIRSRADVYATRELARSQREPVALYGTLSESASFYLDDQGLLKFAKDQHLGLISLAQEHPRIWVLSTPSNAANLQRELPPTCKLVQHPDKQFVFELLANGNTGGGLANRPAHKPR
jgi:4-amino-4-deoxy-L-arabinose transferase-like glycosyltransferase